MGTAAGEATLVTGNPRHFPEAVRGEARVVSPADYLAGRDDDLDLATLTRRPAYFS